MKNKKINLILILVILFAAFVCTTGVASATIPSDKYQRQILFEYRIDNETDSKFAAAEYADTIIVSWEDLFHYVELSISPAECHGRAVWQHTDIAKTGWSVYWCSYTDQPYSCGSFSWSEPVSVSENWVFVHGDYYHYFSDVYEGPASAQPYGTYKLIYGASTFADRWDTVVVRKAVYTYLTVKVDPEGSGTVTKSPGLEKYLEGATLNLTATPSAGYQFDHWSGDLSGSQNPTSIHMDSNKTITAVFEQLPLDLTVSDIVAKVLVDGENATVSATVHSDACFDVNDVKARLLVNDKTIQDVIIDTIPKNSSTNVTFDWWNVSWSVKENKKQPTKIEVVIDPDNEVKETDETNNTASKEIPLAKGKKKKNADDMGFLVTDTSLNHSVLSAIYATPIAIWFDEDATATRHYNPIATDISVLNDIENDFKGTQCPPKAIFSLKITDFYKNALNTFTTFWEPTPYMGIVIVDTKGRSGIAAAPIASYLNWPMAPSPLISAYPDTAKELFKNLTINYTLVIASDKDAVNAIISDLKKLDLDDNQTIFVKGYVVEPLDDLETTDLFKEVLDAYGDKPSSIIVTHSNDVSCAASAPLAAFYKSMVLDVRDVVTKPVDYTPDTFATLKPINSQVNSIIDKAGEHDIKGFIGKYKLKNPSLFLVGTAEYVPFRIKKEPPSYDANDSDSDWIATDYWYYHPSPLMKVVPGGRMPLEGKDNLNYMARALQFADLDVEKRGEWEDDFLVAGIYNTHGWRHWANNNVWWLESVLWPGDSLHGKDKKGTLTQLYEKPSAHNCTWNHTWTKYSGGLMEWTCETPMDYDPNLAKSKGQRIGFNDDYDWIGKEPTGWAEIIRDTNKDGKLTSPPDTIIDCGLNWGIQAPLFSQRVDEEILDGMDNDGDGDVDEDISNYIFREVDDVYNENFTKAPDVDAYIDLIATNLTNHIRGKGIILYNGHGKADLWYLRNLEHWNDSRSLNDVTFNASEVPKLSPSFVIADCCLSGRIWENNSITKAFLKNGALCYLGSTAIAIGGPSDELSKQAIDGIIRKQTIGKAYINAINNVDINHLWGKRFNTSYDSLEKTKYAFSLFGLSSVEIDPPAYEKQNKVSYGTPVYNTDTREWVVNITFDVPKPVEVSDSDETVTEIYFTDIDKYMFDEDGYPALSLIYFDYDLPTGANFSSLSLVNATVYTVYNISQPNVKPKPKREEIKSEEKANLSDIMENRTSVPSGTEAHNFTLNTTITINTTTEVYDEGFEKVELYTGELFPDVLFVNGTEYDSHTNTDKVFGSVTAWQVDGTINKTAVYDKIVLKLTYTAPVGVEETHVVDEKNLTVYAIIVSTDGKTHLVKPSLEIETIGGIRYKEVSAENTTVGETPQIVTFEVSDIELPGYVGRITVTEGGKCVAETSFTVMKPIASFSYTPEKPVVNQTIIFNASNSTDPDGFITNYTWDLGDNETGCGKVTTHAYSSTGNYTVTLTVTDDEGAVNYTSRIVTVREPQPTVTISTDKIVYNPGNTMVTSISFENPTDSAVDTYFVWYLYLPDYDYWIPVMTTSFTLPSGFDECYDSTITIGNWGSRKFNASWRVVLLNTTPPYEIIRQDTAE